jgi:predicted RND superfamily exporter protein
MGVGMDYAIQMHSRIEEEVVLDRAAHPVQAAARGLGPALLVVTFDAVFAFMALWFSRIPAIRQFGSLMVIGIIAVCICSIMLTLATLGIREYRSPTVGKDFSKGLLSRTVVRLGSIPAKGALPLAAFAAVVFVGGVAVEGKLVLQSNPIQWLDPHSQAVKDINTLKTAMGSDNQLGLVVTTDHPFSDQTIDYIVKLTNTEARRYGNLLFPGAGLVSSINQFLTVPGAKDVAPTGSQIEGVALLAPDAIRKEMMADGGHALNVIFLARTNQLSDLAPMIEHIRTDVPPPPGMHVASGGIGVVGVGLLQNLQKSRALLTYLALLFVGAFLAVRLRSLVRSLLSMVPVLVAVGGVSLIAVAGGIKLSPATVVSGPLVVAVCTEFTSLILLRFVEERNRGHDPRTAMDVTAARTGRAFMVSGMTAVAGIGVIATSSMPMLRDFGLIVGMNVLVALLSALVVLPPVLVWAEQHGWVTRGLLRPVPAPIEFERPSRAESPAPRPVHEPIPPPVPVAADDPWSWLDPAPDVEEAGEVVAAGAHPAGALDGLEASVATGDGPVAEGYGGR